MTLRKILICRECLVDWKGWVFQSPSKESDISFYFTGVFLSLKGETSFFSKQAFFKKDLALNNFTKSYGKVLPFDSFWRENEAIKEKDSARILMNQICLNCAIFLKKKRFFIENENHADKTHQAFLSVNKSFLNVFTSFTKKKLTFPLGSLTSYILLKFSKTTKSFYSKDLLFMRTI